MPKNKSKKKGTCVYCGYVGEMTSDHVPPQCLFGPPRPKLITVRCWKCHKATTKDDEYFRLMLTMRDDVFDHGDVQKVLPAVFRSLQKKEQLGFVLVRLCA